MRMSSSRSHAAFLGSVITLAMSAQAFAGTLRIVDWNIEDDINGATTPLPGFNTVLQGLGQEIYSNGTQTIQQAPDIIGLEETTSNAVTVAPIITDLDGDYAGSSWQTSGTFQASESGGDTADGNGPNSIVYNAKTVTMLQAVGVGTALGSGNGEYRQVARYEFQPVNGTAPFYVYVSHMKSGTSSSDATDRGEEAAIIRSNELTLPANASILVMGDLNSAPPEAEFTAFTAAGQGQLSDPANFSASTLYWTESATDLRFRDDYQLMTSNVQGDAGAINYVSGSIRGFGNNGTTPSGGNVSTANNTDLAYMTNANGYPVTQSQILTALTTASDHLPNVAEYTFLSPEPASITLMFGAAGLLMSRRRRAAA